MKLIMSQQEFDEALEKARKEEREKAKYGRSFAGFCFECMNYLPDDNMCMFHSMKGASEYDYCSWARKKVDD